MTAFSLRLHFLSTNHTQPLIWRRIERKVSAAFTDSRTETALLLGRFGLTRMGRGRRREQHDSSILRIPAFSVVPVVLLCGMNRADVAFERTEAL